MHDPRVAYELVLWLVPPRARPVSHMSVRHAPHVLLRVHMSNGVHLTGWSSNGCALTCSPKGSAGAPATVTRAQ